LFYGLSRPRLPVVDVDFTQRVLDHRLALPSVELLAEAPQRHSDDVAVAELGALGDLVQLEPEVMDQVDVFGPELRRMRTEIEVHRLACMGIDDLERQSRARRRQLFPGLAYAAALLGGA